MSAGGIFRVDYRSVAEQTLSESTGRVESLYFWLSILSRIVPC